MFEEGDIITYTREDGTIRVGKFSRYTRDERGIWAHFLYEKEYLTDVPFPKDVTFLTAKAQASLYHKEVQYNPLQQADCEDDI